MNILQRRNASKLGLGGKMSLFGIFSGAIFASWFSDNLTTNKITWQTRLANGFWCIICFYFGFVLNGIWYQFEDPIKLGLIIAWAVLLMEGTKALMNCLSVKKKMKGKYK